MSGIEVVGLLLGALPILFEAIKSCKNGIQSSKTFFRRRAIVNKLSLALLLQQETLVQIVKTILRQSDYDHALDIDQNPYECLSNGQAQDHILEYLGSENLFLLNEIFRQSYDTLQRIARNIIDFVPGTESPTADLRKIIEIHNDRERGWRNFVPRARLIFSASEISQAIQDLDNTTNSLLRLTNLIALNRQPVEQTSTRKTLKLRKGLRQVHRFVVHLHQAILQAWKTDCHNDHEAKLFLEDRIEIAAEISKGTKCGDNSFIMAFHVIFATCSPRKKVSWYKAKIRVSRELADIDLNPSNKSSVGQNARLILAIPENNSTNLGMPLVDDICAVLASVGHEQKQVALILSEDQKMGTVVSKEDPLIPCDHAEKITLRALLCNTKSSSQKANFPLKSRMMLALGLASSLLQLSCTPWLQKSWSKEEIFFLQQPSGAGHYYDFTRPFISLTFNNHDAGTQTQKQIEPRAAFLELGILLLEVWNIETLETHFPEQQSPMEYHQRLALAMKWLDDPNNPPLELYDNAVTHCIHGIIGGEARFQKWEDTKFWDTVCQNIINPLHEICKQWRSLPC